MANKKLTPAQMKIAKMAEPFDAITGADFAALRSKRDNKIKGEAKKPMKFSDNKIKNNPIKPMNFHKQEGVFQEAFKAPVTTKQYPTITSTDSTKIRGAYEYLLKPDSQRQQILKNSRSSATVEQADSYNLNKLRKMAGKYGLDAVKGVRNRYGFGPKR